METLQLPSDLYWDGKLEPHSPSSEIFSLSANSEEFWLFDDNFDEKNVTLEDVDVKTDGLDVTNEELLYEFEYDVKQEQWIDGKPESLSFSEYAPGILPQPIPTPVVKVQNPYEIVMELEMIYGSSELTQLTPPQTPPQNTNDMKSMFNLINSSIQSSEVDAANIPETDILPALSPASSNTDYASDSIGSPISADIAREMQIVDEILRTRAQDLPDWTDDESSICSSSSSQSHSNDDDWSQSPSPSSSSVSSASSPGKQPQSHSTKRRVRPYGRGIEDKKSRKKEQNKNAATRYRQKKKQEMEEILDEERQLVKRNEELSKNVADIEREIKYLKQLIREFHGSKKNL